MPLSVIFKNKNTSDDMLDVMIQLHQYVSSILSTEQAYISSIDRSTSVKTATFHKLFVGGNQLTAARARAVQRHRVNSASPSSALHGLIPCTEDWHTQAILLQVCMYI